jgi:hypothetical protein
MTVYSVLVSIILNVEADSIAQAERAARYHVEHSTLGTIADEWDAAGTFVAEAGTVPDIGGTS